MISDASQGPVLLVDDDQQVLDMMARALRRREIEAVTARRAFGLLNLIAEVRPSVVVLDVLMPGLDGASLVELVRKDAAIARTRILLHSGMGESELARRAAVCQADGYIRKGMGLREAVQTILDLGARGGKTA